MGEYDVDYLLEEAFQKVEEIDRSSSNGSKKPMEDLIMEKAKKAKIAKLDESNKRKHDVSNDEDLQIRRRDKESAKKRSESRDKKRKDERKRRSRSYSDSESRSKKRSRSRERKRKSRSSSRSKSYEKHGRRRRSRDCERSLRSNRRSRSRSRSPWRPRILDHRNASPRRRSPPRSRLPGPERRDVMPFTAKQAPPKNAKLDMTPEERDERTIFILQLSSRTRPIDLEEFFSSVGHVRDVRIITDSKTHRSKGIAYVEFWEKDAVPLAMGLNGQKLNNAPLVIQMTCAERNRVANSSMGGAIGFGIADTSGPLKICVSNLHPHITDDMLNAIFEPFGKIDQCTIIKDSMGLSKGHGFVYFRHAEDGKKAIEQLNGFELAGKNIRLATVEDDVEANSKNYQYSNYVEDQSQPSLESEDRNLSSHGRLHLMAKLAEGSGINIPQSTKNVLAHQQGQQNDGIPAIATQCFMLSNMFDPATESEEGWEFDVRDDVIDECNTNGGVVHIYVDKASPQGNVYVKCPSVAVAHRSVVALHGRWFAGKIITANYVPVNSYHDLFPEAKSATVSLLSKRR